MYFLYASELSEAITIPLERLTSLRNSRYLIYLSLGSVNLQWGSDALRKIEEEIIVRGLVSGAKDALELFSLLVFYLSTASGDESLRFLVEELLRALSVGKKFLPLMGNSRRGANLCLGLRLARKRGI